MRSDSLKSAPDVFMNSLLAKPPSERFEYLASLSKAKRGEDDLIDYKTGAPGPDDVQPIWSKALSGFANAGGGILVWGIDAPKNLPEKVVPVSDVHKFKAKLLQLLPHTVEPPVSPPQIETVEGDNPPWFRRMQNHGEPMETASGQGIENLPLSHRR
jgi:hypothetical protein